MYCQNCRVLERIKRCMVFVMRIVRCLNELGKSKVFVVRNVICLNEFRA